jgi:hypothetical protein
MENNNTLTKECLVCGKPLVKYKYESMARFNKKKCCGTTCSRELMKKNKVGWYARDSKERLFTDFIVEE